MLVKKMSFRVICAASVIALPMNVWAADNTRQPGVVDREAKEVKLPKRFAIENEVKKGLKEEPAIQQANAQEKVATLHTINVKGNSVLPQEEVDAIVANFLNKEVTALDIAKLKYTLTRKFYDAGYILVRVVTPKQSLSDGVLNIDVYEAKVGGVELKNKSKLHPAVIDAIKGRVTDGRIFQENDVESMVSDLNDLRNIRANVNLEPGKEFGTTDVVLNVEDTYENVQQLSVDNYGSPLTGEVVTRGHFEYSNLVGFGETASLDIRRSDQNMWSVGGGLEAPIAVSNLRLGAYGLHSENKIGDRLDALYAKGETDSLDVYLVSDLLNTRRQKLTARVGFNARDHETTLAEVTENLDEIRQMYAQIEYLERLDEGIMFLQGRVSHGADIFGQSERGALNVNGGSLASNAGGDQDALVFKPFAYFNFYSPFGDDGAFKVTFSGQFASHQLLSSELYAIGGYGSVRGFEPSHLTGESGIQYSVEYSHPIEWVEDVDIAVGPFFDGGKVYNRVNNGLNDYSDLFAAGLGVEMRTELSTIGTTILRLDWAHTLGNYNTDQDLDGDLVFETYAQDPSVNQDWVYFRLTQKF